jgi:tetratricopeptide (TPR) repeat protein
MVEFFAAQLAASRTDSAVDAAQEIMFDAWECDDRRQRLEMARKALKVSPDCADAYVLLAEETSSSPGEKVHLYAQGVSAGERALGKAAFIEDVGMFWGLLETRPYMRARLGLALALWNSGRQDEAITHCWEMLRLNPNDNQGVRYLLLDWLLRVGLDDEIGRLMAQYRGDAGVEWLWSAALAAFRRQGDCVASRKALTRASRSNPHVRAYLIKRKQLPRNIPEYVAIGGEDEAAAYADQSAATWTATPGALAWLAAATTIESGHPLTE